MNSTLLTFVFNLTRIDIKSWFIPFDILMILFTALAVIFSIIFLLCILIDKRCHTIPMMLTANTCLAELIMSTDAFCIAIYTLHNDLNQIKYGDFFCIFRGYLTYVSCAMLNYSFLLQAFYRYVLVVHSTSLFLQSIQFQLFFICITWMISFVYPIGFLFNGNIIYNVDNQICQIPLQLSFSMVFLTLCLYMIPVSLIIFIYLKLVRYVKQMRHRITVVNTLSRARRQLRIVRRTIILVTILIAICFVYAIFIFISFFTDPPKYHFRIAYVIGNLSTLLLMIVLFRFTKPIIICIKEIINRRLTCIISNVTFN
ncbi:unnamed protein product [Adineta steineri]|uniref:G-protein coupled receptors family 1 profile domain-containing protein n=2 Tax=Adineta steineri TaxID=433720 RepID=A0A813Z954_9BILA|nr:unnamed protein product [Adineta steineri]